MSTYLAYKRTTLRPLALVLLLSVVVFAGLLSMWNKSVEAQAMACAENPSNKMQCFTAVIDGELTRAGLSAAFDAVAYLYEADEDFASVCHGNVHELGDAAYRVFQSGGALVLSPKASYCGYGFYHGFMERLITTEGNADRGVAFCGQVGDELRAETADAEGACFHGIGHGAVDGTFPETWGNPEAILAPGLALCERTLGSSTLGAHDFGPLYRCVTGAYNSIEVLSQDKRYKLSRLTEDPFHFCATQKTSYRPGCYTNMLPILLRSERGDLLSIIDAIDALQDEWGGHEMRRSIIRDLVHEYARLNPQDREGGVSLCRAVDDVYRLACFEGVAGGFMKYGPPMREYEQAVSFCGAESLLSDERDACFGYVLPRLRNFYSLDTARAVCAGVPANVRDVYCKAYE